MSNAKVALMDKTGKSVKTNIVLGYISFILIAVVMVGLIYSEVIKMTQNRVDLQPVNAKMSLVNAALTNLYQAEGFERSYLQTQNRQHYRAYTQLMDSVAQQIDSIAHIGASNMQHLPTDSLQLLLALKRQNFKELVAIKNAGTSEELYQRAMREFASERDSINQLLSIYKTVTTNTDSVLVLQRKQRFFERILNVFSPQEEVDSTLRVVVHETTQVDSILDTFNPADSVAQLMTLVIQDIKKESIALERKLNQKEQDILENDKVITMKIRQMFVRFENEIVHSSLLQVQQQQQAVANMSRWVVVLGILALIVIVGFLILILKDISKSQHYRQRLEREKAYSETLLKHKEQFMLSITHDLKSPLSSIIGYAHLVGQESHPQHQKHYLENINQSASYILRLINDLIDFVRLETGKLKIEQVRFKLKDVLDEVLEGFYPLATQKNVRLTVHETLPPEAVFLSDPVRIKQVLGNLLSNAIKFTDKGRVAVKCSVTKMAAQKMWVQLVVEDTGIGISEENTQVIFEEFSRVSPEDGRQYEGTGLGLTITKRIVELLGGKISLESRYGQGSRFTVLLPLPICAKDAPSQAWKAAPLPLAEATAAFHYQQVLLVDDDPVLLEMMMKVLQSHKLRIQSFSDPGEALAALAKESFDLLITDIQMPQTSGFELLAAFKQAQSRAKAIAVSGKALPAEDFEKAGFSAFLEKPFQPDQLVSTIASVLGDQPIAEEQKRRKAPSEEAYTLDSIKAFAAGDPDALRQILASFVENTGEHLQLFRHYLEQEDLEGLSKLAHKMLPLFRQLEVKPVIRPLEALEQPVFDKEDKAEWMAIGNSALEEVVRLVQQLCEDHQFALPEGLMS